MCQTRCGESRVKCIYEGIAVNKITNKYLKKGSMSKVGISMLMSGYSWYENIIMNVDGLADTDHTLTITLNDGTEKGEKDDIKRENF